MAQTSPASATASSRETTLRHAQRAAQVILDAKGSDVLLLDLKDVTDMTDFFVIASGTSDTHVRSTAQRVEEELRKEGLRVHHEEGLQQGRWALLDFVDFVVHIFHPTMRQFYQLERLWGDAREVPVGQAQSVGQPGALK